MFNRKKSTAVLSYIPKAKIWAFQKISINDLELLYESIDKISLWAFLPAEAYIQFVLSAGIGEFQKYEGKFYFLPDPAKKVKILKVFPNEETLNCHIDWFKSNRIAGFAFKFCENKELVSSKENSKFDQKIKISFNAISKNPPHPKLYIQVLLFRRLLANSPIGWTTNILDSIKYKDLTRFSKFAIKETFTWLTENTAAHFNIVQRFMFGGTHYLCSSDEDSLSPVFGSLLANRNPPPVLNKMSPPPKFDLDCDILIESDDEDKDELIKHQHNTIINLTQKLAEKEELFAKLDEILEEHNESARDCGFNFIDIPSDYTKTLSNVKLESYIMVKNMSDNKELPFKVFKFVSLAARSENKDFRESFKRLYNLFCDILAKIDKNMAIKDDYEFLRKLEKSFKGSILPDLADNDTNWDHVKVAGLLDAMSAEIFEIAKNTSNSGQVKSGPFYACEFKKVFGSEIGLNIELLRNFINFKLAENRRKNISILSNAAQFVDFLKQTVSNPEVRKVFDFAKFCETKFDGLDNSKDLSTFFSDFQCFTKKL